MNTTFKKVVSVSPSLSEKSWEHLKNMGWSGPFDFGGFDFDNCSLFEWAIEKINQEKNKKVLDFLISEKCLNVFDGRDNTLLSVAIFNAPFLVEGLLQKGANPNLCDRGQNTSLFRLLNLPTATLDQVLLLINYGANPSHINRFKETPLLFACRTCPQAAIYLAQNFPLHINQADIDDKTPLMVAIENLTPPRKNKNDAVWEKERTHLIECLIDSGANLEAKNINGQTALMVALKNKQEFLCHLLINRGASLTACDNKNKDVLSYARQFQVLENEISSRIEKEKLDVQIPSYNSRNPKEKLRL